MASANVKSEKTVRMIEVEEEQTVVVLTLTPQESRDLRRVLAVAASVEAADSQSERQQNYLSELELAGLFINEIWDALLDASHEAGANLPSGLIPSWENVG